MFAGIFALLNVYGALKYIQTFMTKTQFRNFFIGAVIVATGIVFLGVLGLTWTGKSRFYPLG